MDIAQLRTLVHVAELGSVSKAADRLGIAQPALSRQIRLLEHQLNAPLFTRHGRGMVLTDLGRDVLKPAEEIFAKLAEIRALAVDDRAEPRGRVRFGMTPTVADIMTVPLATRLHDRHPRLSLCISTAFSGHLLDWLKRDEVDCCVSYDPDVSGTVRTLPILAEALALVGAGETGLSGAGPVRFAKLAEMTLILPSRLHGLRRIADHCALQAGVRLEPAIEVDSLRAIIDLVRVGRGVTILPRAAAYDDIEAGRLSAAPLVDPVPSRRVAVTIPSDREVSTATRAACAMFGTIASELVERGIWAGELLS